MSHVATDLETAFRYLNPQNPLDEPAQLKRWFCERHGSPRGELAARLRAQGKDGADKYLFSGHRGSGKSTELSKLAEEVGGEFFIVRFSAARDLDLRDLEASDLVLEMLSRMVEAGHKLLPKRVLKQVEDLTATVTREVVVERVTAATGGAGLDLGIVELGARIGKEAVTRETVRKEVRPRLTEFLDTAALVASHMRCKSKKPVLLVVEDLDKLDPAPAADLFFQHGSSLMVSGFSVIYTFPIALRRHRDFQQIERMFSEGLVLPNFPVRKRGGGRNEQAIEDLARILRVRVGEGLLPDEPARELAWLSGGLVLDLVRLARTACIAAMEAGKRSAGMDEVERVKARGIEEFDVVLTREQRALLAQVHAAQALGDNDEAHRELLHNLAALEYGDEQPLRYYDVHPLAEPLIRG